MSNSRDAVTGQVLDANGRNYLYYAGALTQLFPI
jgi:hypothetical protein